jgi:hypothetical protein
VDVGDHDIEEGAGAIPIRRLMLTVGLSFVGPPPVLMMIHPFARATIEGSPSSTVSPPSTSV